jgi:ferritin-like metal-binding protein YciE
MDELRHPPQVLSKQELHRFFISHLHRIYCAKSQLVDKLPELSRRAGFLDLRQAIDETVELVRLQNKRIRRIYIALDETYHQEKCTGLTGLLDEAFQAIGLPGETPSICDLSILFYMQNIESVEMASFKLLIMVAGGLLEPEVSQLLTECYDEAREDKQLFKAITGKYF